MSPNFPAPTHSVNSIQRQMEDLKVKWVVQHEGPSKWQTRTQAATICGQCLPCWHLSLWSLLWEDRARAQEMQRAVEMIKHSFMMLGMVVKAAIGFNELRILLAQGCDLYPSQFYTPRWQKSLLFSSRLQIAVLFILLSTQTEDTVFFLKVLSSPAFFFPPLALFVHGFLC